MNNLVKGILFGFIAQVITFLQLQGQFQYKWVKDNLIVITLITSPIISFLFIYSVQGFVAWAGGEIWPSRLIGFAIGIIVFTLGSTFLFGEHLSLKTIICLMLAIGILTVQLVMK
jgi:hypothetical protein